MQIIGEFFPFRSQRKQPNGEKEKKLAQQIFYRLRFGRVNQLYVLTNHNTFTKGANKRPWTDFDEYGKKRNSWPHFGMYNNKLLLARNFLMFAILRWWKTENFRSTHLWRRCASHKAKINCDTKENMKSNEKLDWTTEKMLIDFQLTSNQQWERKKLACDCGKCHRLKVTIYFCCRTV